MGQDPEVPLGDKVPNDICSVYRGIVPVQIPLLRPQFWSLDREIPEEPPEDIRDIHFVVFFAL